MLIRFTRCDRGPVAVRVLGNGPSSCARSRLTCHESFFTRLLGFKFASAVGEILCHLAIDGKTRFDVSLFRNRFWPDSAQRG